MSSYSVLGGKPLFGAVEIQSAKNAVLPAMAASILTKEPLRLHDLPAIRDVLAMQKILERLGVRLKSEGRSLVCLADGPIQSEVLYPYSRQLRGSVLLMGPLLARLGEVRIALPGGCDIGRRPIDLHLKGLTALGAEVQRVAEGYRLKSDGLCGTRIHLDFPSHTATENLMLAAVLAKGTTVIENAAMEPEIVDLAELLTEMGARIQGAGTPTLVIEGVERLRGASHRCIPDRIEAGTYLVAGAITAGALALKNVCPEHLQAAIQKLVDMGCRVETADRQIYIEAPRRLIAADIQTRPYPGFPTDLQPPFMAALCLAEGSSVISENIFDRRFGHVPELQKLGADIHMAGQIAFVRGRDSLRGNRVLATDLRAGAGVLLACLAARGESEILQVEHMERGYARLVENLRSLGAEIHPSPQAVEERACSPER